jgi:hypothetical protein
MFTSLWAIQQPRRKEAGLPLNVSFSSACFIAWQTFSAASDYNLGWNCERAIELVKRASHSAESDPGGPGTIEKGEMKMLAKTKIIKSIQKSLLKTI